MSLTAAEKHRKFLEIVARATAKVAEERKAMRPGRKRTRQEDAAYAFTFRTKIV
jgi:hypothetical protein